jgi:hypothetical protein
MDKDTQARAAAEAASQATGGFFQGLGWGAATAAIALVALHPVIVAGAVVASGAALATKKWRSRDTLDDPANGSTGRADSPLPKLLARVRERVKSAI